MSDIADPGLAERGMRFDYPPITGLEADLLLVTHEHGDHNAVERVGGDPVVLRSTAGTFHSPIGEVVAVASEHDTAAGTQRGPNMLVAFSVSPLGTGETVGAAVAEAVRVVRASGLPNRTDAMFTTIEGEWDEVMAVVKAATEAVAAHAPRVSLVLKADIRPGFTDLLTAKIASVERHLEV